jgi:hypothetical protein
MTEHKFRVGQLVRLQRGDTTSAADLYQVVHLIPGTPERELQYRLRGIYEAHERMAVEGQISRAVHANPDSATQVSRGDSA